MTGLLEGATGLLIDDWWRADASAFPVYDTSSLERFTTVRRARARGVDDALPGNRQLPGDRQATEGPVS